MCFNNFALKLGRKFPIRANTTLDIMVRWLLFTRKTIAMINIWHVSGLNRDEHSESNIQRQGKCEKQ